MAQSAAFLALGLPNNCWVDTLQFNKGSRGRQQMPERTTAAGMRRRAIWQWPFILPVLPEMLA